MKQSTLFENQIKRIPNKKAHENIHSTSDVKEPKLKKVTYMASKIDSDVIDGFDASLTDWIYPTNYPVREYQLQIVQECLFKNTLVCLPTGLGKTFIASVAMYNFYRWYPNGKIIFVAPTRPLVCQQMMACQDIIPINKSDFIELTGSINRNNRINLWKEKRVFFLTAQVLVNDLISQICPGKSIVLVVLDEAHKASKNHAYCQVIRELTGSNYDNRLFRVLGLSATPGDDIKSIQDVIANLLISHIELRTDECKDIKMYSHERLVEEVIVPLGSEVLNIRDKLLAICLPIIDRLKAKGLITENYAVNKLSKFGLLKMKDEYKAKNGGYYSSYVLSDFNQLISLYYAVELVQQHGIKPTFLYFANAISSSHSNPQILELMMNKDFMDFFAQLEQQSGPEMLILGHPKLGKLKEIIYEHFTTKNTEDEGSSKISRVIIFSQIRDSVEEIIKLLQEMKPLVRPIAFMGKTKNVSQREQMEAMRLFTEGEANVLVSTCIGEEGLDIGEVDLIICFDSQKSPIRLIQRAGRTGRKRQGRVVMLLSEGKEVRNYRTSLSKKSHIHKAIFEGYKHLVFYPDNPRMVPLTIDPVVTYSNVTIAKCEEPSTKKSNRKSLKKAKMTDINPDEFIDINIQLHVPERMLSLNENEDTNKETFTKRYEIHRYKKSFYQSQKTFKIGHSSLTTDFLSILKLKEIHRRGKANILFHLSSSRIMDMEDPLSESETNEHSSNSLSISLSSADDTSEPYQAISCLHKIDGCTIIGRSAITIRPPMPSKEFANLLNRVEKESLDLIEHMNYAIEVAPTRTKSPSFNDSFSFSDDNNDDIIDNSPSFDDDMMESTTNYSPLHDNTAAGTSSTRCSSPDSTSQQIIKNDSSSNNNVLDSVTNYSRLHLPVCDTTDTGLSCWSPIGRSSMVAALPQPISTNQGGPITSTPKMAMKNILSLFNIDPNLSSNPPRHQLLMDSFTVLPTNSFNKVNETRFGIESALNLFNDTIDAIAAELSSDLFSDDLWDTTECEKPSKIDPPSISHDLDFYLESDEEFEQQNALAAPRNDLAVADGTMTKITDIDQSDSDNIYHESDEEFEQEISSNAPVVQLNEIPKPLDTVSNDNRGNNNLSDNEDLFPDVDDEELDFDFSDDDLKQYSPKSNHSLSPSFDDCSYNDQDSETQSQDVSQQCKRTMSPDIMETQIVDNPTISQSLSPSFINYSPNITHQSPVTEYLSIGISQRSRRLSMSPNLMDNQISENVDPCRSPSPSFIFCDTDVITQSPGSRSHLHSHVSISPDFLETQISDRDDIPDKIITRPPAKPNLAQQYFFSQAMIDGNPNDHIDESDDDEDNMEPDEYDSSFIDDQSTIETVPNTQMHQIYLQSIRSPYGSRPLVDVANNNNRIRNNPFIYSQLPSTDEDDDYMIDSFVVPDNCVTPPKSKRSKKRRPSSPVSPKRKFKRLAPMDDSF